MRSSLSAPDASPLSPLLPSPPADLLTEASLFLDFDGTLVDIVERPDAVAVDATLSMLMGDLARKLQGRVAIVSGRPRAEIQDFFEGQDFAVAGSHGLELRWPDGRIEAPETSPELAAITERLRELSARHFGTMVEEKPFGVAIHYRGAPQSEQACRTLAEQLATGSAFTLQAGKMVFELRLRGADKGAALRSFMSEPPMRGTVPVFIGDDLTDEHAFAAAAELGGHGVLVGQGRETSAHFHLRDVATARAWLSAAVEALA